MNVLQISDSPQTSTVWSQLPTGYSCQSTGPLSSPWACLIQNQTNVLPQRSYSYNVKVWAIQLLLNKMAFMSDSRLLDPPPGIPRRHGLTLALLSNPPFSFHPYRAHGLTQALNITCRNWFLNLNFCVFALWHLVTSLFCLKHINIYIYLLYTYI